MKKSFFLAIALLSLSLTTFANEPLVKNKEIGLNVGLQTDIVSSYLWRGTYLGALSLQPCFYLNYQGIALSGWWNVGTDNWQFKNLNPEMDLTLGFNRWGIALDFTHYYYFQGDKFLDKNCDMTDPDNASRSTIEGHFGFHLGDLLEDVPLSLDWYTTLWGGDGYYPDGSMTLKRAYSSYVEVGYDADLPLGFVLGARLGVVPWRSSYTGYEPVWTGKQTIGIQNIQLSVNREFKIQDLYLTPFATVMLNCYGLNKENFCPADPAERHFHWCIGGTICFDKSW